MDRDAFHELCHQASHLAVKEPGRIGNLVLSLNERGESIIREPEVLYAFCRTLDTDRRAYGVEVPTFGLYRFVKKDGVKTMRARHDLVLVESGKRDVLIEFKKGQPGGTNSPTIGKDFQKLLREDATSGKAMFHICQAAKKRTIPALIKKYNVAFADARTIVAGHDLSHNDEKWFALYILVMIDRTEKRSMLLSKVADSLPEPLANDPVFDHLDRELIPSD